MAPNQAAGQRRVFLFGALRIQDEHGPHSLTSSKAVSLFAYLLLHANHRHRREMLAELLSPDLPPDRVRRNFTDTLYRLRQALGDDWLDSDASTIAVSRGPHLWLDVWEFDHLVTRGHNSDLLKAIELYTGELLPEIYDEWILGERELRRARYLVALEKLAAHKRAEGELQDALLYTRRLIAAEPLHEPAHRSYMQLLGRLERYGEALAHYDDLRTLFRSELGAEPLAETRALAQSIQAERDIGTVSIPRERTLFVGRVPERAAALAAIEDALAGHGGILAIEGAAGIGKSRLAREILTSARWRGVTVLQAAASETPGTSPFQPLVDALTPILNSPRRQQLELLLPAETLAALVPLYQGWRDDKKGDDTPSKSVGNRFLSALYPFGETLARLTPLLLLFDDLHWANPAFWESLSVLLPALKQNGALVLLVYRRPEIEHTPGWKILQAWDRAESLTTCTLEPLGVQEVAQWIGDNAAVDPVEIHALTGGSPFLISEWLAEPTASQLTRQYTAARRLYTLSPDARRALESAAVLGESVPNHLWSEMSDLPPLALANSAEELCELHWLQPSDSGYTFVHDLIRTAVYEQIDPHRRRELHQRSALAYIALDPDNVRARAFHFDRAGVDADAAAAYRLAGEQDQARLAFREAQSAFERALELMPPLVEEARVETTLALVQVCEITGDYARRRSAAIEALALAMQLENPELMLQAMLEMGRAAGETGHVSDVREAKRCFREAVLLARELQDTFREIQALFELGFLASQQGEWNEAQKYYTRSQAQIREIRTRAGPEWQSAASTLDRIDNLIRSILARRIGAEPELIKQLERELAIHRRDRNRLDELSTCLTLLGAYYNLGDWDHLLTTAAEYFPVAKEVGDLFKATTIQYIQGLAAYCLGDYLNARSFFLKVHEGYLATNDQRSAGLAINMLGLVAEGEGRMAEAGELLQQALAGALARETRLEAAYAQHDLGALRVRLEQPLEAIPLLDGACAAWTDQSNSFLRLKSESFLGLALVAAGERARAEALAATGWNAFQEGVPLGELPQAWLWGLYRLLSAINRDGPASTVLRAAYRELQRQACTISDHDLRRSFFENVWLNHEIVLAHDQLIPTQRVISFRLARKSAPLGRALLPEEWVTVQWTLSAPEDEALSDKAERRRYRLRRLLGQARDQQAAPTDDDLADVLSVSRRTILRDMQTIIDEQNKRPTRKRKFK